MADGQLKLSRRALLGVACAGSALSGAIPSVRFEPPDAFFGGAQDKLRREAMPSGAEALQAAWRRALDRLRRAEAAVAALERSPDEEAFGDAVVAFNRTLERLLLAPAPDLSALALKLRLARRHLAWELAKGEEAMAVVEADAFRLAGR